MTIITVVGRATQDAELRYIPSGKAVCEVSVAVNHRKKQGDQWVDDGTTFYRCTGWDHLAEQMGEQIRRGKRYIVQGDLRNREYETKDGEKRRSLEIRVREIGPALDRYPPRDTPAPAVDSWAGGGHNDAGNSEPPF